MIELFRTTRTTIKTTRTTQKPREPFKNHGEANVETQGLEPLGQWRAMVETRFCGLGRNPQPYHYKWKHINPSAWEGPIGELVRRAA